MVDWIRSTMVFCSGVTSRSSSSIFSPAIIRRASALEPVGEAPDGLVVDLDRPQVLVQQPLDVAGQPGHPAELAAVGGLVKGDPEAEVGRAEVVAPLSGHDVGDHIPDGPLAVGPDGDGGVRGTPRGCPGGQGRPVAVGGRALVGAGQGRSYWPSTRWPT